MKNLIQKLFVILLLSSSSIFTSDVRLDMLVEVTYPEMEEQKEEDIIIRDDVVIYYEDDDLNLPDLE